MERPTFVPMIKKMVPGETSPRQNTVATADSSVVNQEIETAGGPVYVDKMSVASTSIAIPKAVKTYN